MRRLFALARTRKVEDVVGSHGCLGCGACVGLMPSEYAMVDRPEFGLRPVRRNKGAPDPAPVWLQRVCPGLGAWARPGPSADEAGQPIGLDMLWGKVLEIWEGHASCANTRWRGSSGGVVSALASFALEFGLANGVVHARRKADDPLANETAISRTPKEVKRAAGSRYAPASPCDRLADMARPGERLVFVGKPCDVQALAHAQEHDRALAANTVFRISIFCAGTPSKRGVDALVREMDVPSGASIIELKYRGEGWPGTMSARYRDRQGRIGQSRAVSYERGWGEILQKHRQWRCHLCADHTGEFADLSIGDPWDRPRSGEEGAGSSLIVVRTERGRDLLRAAMAAGAILACRRANDALDKAQPNLARQRRQIWGRLFAMRLIGLRPPRYRGWGLAGLWWRETSAGEKARSMLGVIRRAIRRRLWMAEITRADAGR